MKNILKIILCLIIGGVIGFLINLILPPLFIIGLCFGTLLGTGIMSIFQVSNDEYKPMLWFTHRKELEKRYIQWVEKEKVSNSAFNVISFLEIKGLLDNEKIISFLRNGENNYDTK